MGFTKTAQPTTNSIMHGLTLTRMSASIWILNWISPVVWKIGISLQEAPVLFSGPLCGEDLLKQPFGQTAYRDRTLNLETIRLLPPPMKSVMTIISAGY